MSVLAEVELVTRLARTWRKRLRSREGLRIMNTFRRSSYKNDMRVAHLAVPRQGRPAVAGRSLLDRAQYGQDNVGPLNSCGVFVT